MKKLKAFFYIFKNSAFKPVYYLDVLKVKFNFSLKYFLFFFFVISFLTAATMSFSVVQKGRPFLEKVKKTVPQLYPKNLNIDIKDGQVSTNVPEPFFIPIDPELFPPDISKALKTQPIQNIMVIDTSVPPSEIKKYQTFVLLTKDSVAFLGDQGEIRIQSLEEVKEFTINKDVINTAWQQVLPFFDKVIPFVIVALFLFIPPAFVIGKFFYLLFLTFLTWIIAQVYKLRSVNYGKALQINLHAITLPTIIVSVFQLLGVTPKIPFFQTIILLIFILIIFSSIKEKVKQEAK